MAAVVLGAQQSGGRKGVCGRMKSVPGTGIGTGNGVWHAAKMKECDLFSH